MKRFFVLALLTGLTAIGCGDARDRNTGVYLLLGSSGASALELKKAQVIVNHLLGALGPKDSLAVACVDTGSFSEKDILAQITFHWRPSTANIQKRAFQKKMIDCVTKTESRPDTDLSGGILQAIEYLNEIGVGKKYILIFSDLEEAFARGSASDIPFQLSDVTVIALNVAGPQPDGHAPGDYRDRVERWRTRVERGGGRWRQINDMEQPFLLD